MATLKEALDQLAKGHELDNEQKKLIIDKWQKELGIQPCENAISRQEVIETLKELDWRYNGHPGGEVYSAIYKLSPVQPIRPKGHWERHYSRPNVYADLYWHCSECSFKSTDYYANHYRFCPYCGCQMDEVAE